MPGPEENCSPDNKSHQIFSTPANTSGQYSINHYRMPVSAYYPVIAWTIRQLSFTYFQSCAIHSLFARPAALVCVHHLHFPPVSFYERQAETRLLLYQHEHSCRWPFSLRSVALQAVSAFFPLYRERDTPFFLNLNTHNMRQFPVTLIFPYTHTKEPCHTSLVSQLP